MSKTYTFQDPYYTIEVPVTTAVSAVAVVYCVYHAIVGGAFTPGLYLLFAAAGVYQVWNVLVSAAYPHDVVVDDESISFVSKTRTDTYRIADLDDISVRANRRNGRLFVRIAHPTIFRGRYWIGSQDFSDGAELFDYLIDLEVTVHPDGIRARSMR